MKDLPLLHDQLEVPVWIRELRDVFEGVAVYDQQIRIRARPNDTRGTPSRSAVLQRAIGLLRAAGLEEEYAAAWDEWDTAEDAVLWATSVSDGVVDAPG